MFIIKSKNLSDARKQQGHGSSSDVLAGDVEEALTEVLPQLVRDGDEQAQISVEWFQEQVELHLE